MSTPANKVERLALAAAVAPVLRRQTESTKSRRVKVYSQETGEVVAEATLAEVQAGILATARIELDTADGVKSTHRECSLCGAPFAAGGNGNSRTCNGCRARQQTSCAGDGCDAAVPASAMCPSYVRRRGGAPWKCRECAKRCPERRARQADVARRVSLDPEWRAKVAEAARIRSQDPEWIEKNAESMRRLAQDPDWRAKQVETMRRLARDPGWRDGQSQRMRRVWADRRAKKANHE